MVARGLRGWHRIPVVPLSENLGVLVVPDFARLCSASAEDKHAKVLCKGARLHPVIPAVRAIRGATTVDADTADQVAERTRALVSSMLERNGVAKDDLISILFTATDDIHSVFPATCAREVGLGDVPLICARELDIVGGTPRCIRVMMHVVTGRSRAELHHVYLEGARGLRDDLPE